MKDCIASEEREGGCYHEFYRGKWDGASFWKPDSLLLHDDVLGQRRGFVDAVLRVIPNYDSCGVTEVSREQWVKIGKALPVGDKESRELYQEIDAWAGEVFRSADCFSILGI